MLDPWAIRNSRWKKVVAHWLYEGPHLRGAQCLRALCEPEARALRDLGLKNDIAIIPNGIDLPSGSPLCPPPWKNFVEPGSKVLLFLSRIHPKKGLMNLLRAWARVQAALGNARAGKWILAIAGWDQAGHEAQLKQLATELTIPWTDIRAHATASGPMADGPVVRSPVVSGPSIGSPCSVIFLGPQFQDPKAACYHYCDAFVLASLSEGVPMVVLEAWASSKPVLMTPQCNLPQGFSGGAALQAEPTADSLAEGLDSLISMTDGDRAAMGTRARTLVADRFVWPRIAVQMKEVYEWMLGGGAKPDCVADL
jgi:poly(glycerol-phosphate) alpha-glucosyltransferase